MRKSNEEGGRNGLGTRPNSKDRPMTFFFFEFRALGDTSLAQS